MQTSMTTPAASLTILTTIFAKCGEDRAGRQQSGLRERPLRPTGAESRHSYCVGPSVPALRVVSQAEAGWV